MHNSSVNSKDRWPKTLPSALNVLVSQKGGKNPPVQQYGSSEVVALTTKGNPSGFRGDYYNCGNSRHMSQYCPEPRKEEVGNYGQVGEDAQIQINLAEEDTYNNVEVFELLFLGVEENNNEPERIAANITRIERRTDKNSLLNKVNETRGPGKAVSPWWMILDSQPTVNAIIINEVVKFIRNSYVHFVHVRCNSVTRIIRTEATLAGFGTVWFDGRCITNIISLSKAKIITVSCMIARMSTNSSWLFLTSRSC